MRISRALLGLVLLVAGCVGPIGDEQHQAALDPDRDGVVGALDCDPGDPAVNPGAVEWCNGIDDDCDGAIDEGDARGVRPFWPDADADGFGDSLAAVVWACAAPAGHVDNDSDCRDDLGAVNPGVAGEVCNGLDDDCDGLVDNGATDLQDYFLDSDDDGFGAGPAVAACTAPADHVDNDDDCDDGDPTRSPARTETCDGRDEDCDGLVDNGAVATTWYGDVDGDGFGGSIHTVESCIAPPGWQAAADDCNDADPNVNPLVPEVCNGIDDNCSGLLDDADPGILPGAMNDWYQDLDGDGDGDGTISVQACEQPPQHTSSGSDCDDTDPTVFFQAPELCDGVDNDCDGPVDEVDADVPGQHWFFDGDGDGYGGSTEFVGCTPPADHFPESLDCDDADPLVNPGEAEICGDGVDNDCDQQGCRLEGDLGLGAGATQLLSTLGGSEHGASLLGADWTDDGLVDLAVGGPGAGRVLLFAGPMAPGPLDETDAWTTVTGAAGDRLGAGLARGELTADGIADLVIGAPASTLGSPGGGAVWLLAGPLPPGPVDATVGSVASVVGTAGEGIGAQLAVGSLGGTVTGDLALGAPTAGVGGQVGVFLALAGAHDFSDAPILLSGAVGDAAGTGLAVAHDFDGDSLHELVVGSPGADSGAGAVDLVEPVIGSLDLGVAASRRWTGSASQQLGQVVADAGDLDGDGYPDLLLAGPGSSVDHPGGAVFAVAGGFAPSGPLGGVSLAVFERAVGPDGLFALASGDLDDDGVIDVILSDASGAGQAWLFYGPVGGVLALETAHDAHFTGSAPARFGSALLATDLNDDGIDDVGFGSPLEGIPAEPGAVTLFFGEGF